MQTHSRLVGHVLAFYTREIQIVYFRVLTSTNVSAIVVSVFHAKNVTLLRHIRHHEGLWAVKQSGKANDV